MKLPFYVKVVIALSMLLSAAIFGFFYAWVCSTMWGLDSADPRISIAAMQAMNASVRNAVFFPAFFLTPLALGISSVTLLRHKQGKGTAWFATAALTYFCFGLLLTMLINVPMNEALATVEVPDNVNDAMPIWQDYSQTWQFWNQARTIASGVSVLMATIGLLSIAQPRQSQAV